MARPLLPLLLLPVAALPLAAVPAAAQAWEDPGPHVAAWRDVSFAEPGLGTIPARVYHPALGGAPGSPADPSAGPYPLAAFLHGWLGSPEAYDELCLHVATWGYVVASIGTETGFFADPQAEAQDTAALLAWADAQSDVPGSFLKGMVSDAHPWSALGHSMGGTALQHLVGVEPAVRAIVPLEPAYAGSGAALASLAAFDGDVLVLGGSVDAVTPVATNAVPYFEAAGAAARRAYVELQGGGHGGPLDVGTPGEPLSAEEQHRLHRRLGVAFLEAEVRGVEDAWLDLVGEGATGEPVEREAVCADPPLWVAASATVPQSLVVGLAGAPGDLALLGLSLAPASVPTPFGVLGLDPATLVVFATAPLGAEGWHEALLPLGPGTSGVTAWLQGAALAGATGALTRTAVYAVR